MSTATIAVLDSPSGPAAAQQPSWEDLTEVDRVRDELSGRPGLVGPDDVRQLRALLADVAADRAHVIQAGDCAEDPAECAPEHVAAKTGLLDALGDALAEATGRPVLRAGRIGGQLAKPRSRPTELVDGTDLPVYRGHMVNEPAPDPAARRPDPNRLLAGYDTAAAVVRQLGWRGAGRRVTTGSPVWTSHEALLLDYEQPLLREDRVGRTVLASTHWPWIGNRTRGLDGAHVRMLARVVNPVACKIDGSLSPDAVARLCERLDPFREPGRLTLISRVGSADVRDTLPRLVRAVRAAGHPAIWLCDPMHGNTVVAPSGHKTRYVRRIREEIAGFRAAVAEGGGVAGGLHLETTPQLVSECVEDESEADRVSEFYTSLCDPRLNPAQAFAAVREWSR